MLDWLNKLFETVFTLFPRLIIIRTTHRGVKFRNGYDLILLQPGRHFFWPLMSEVDIVNVARTTLNLPNQRLVTHDGKRLVVSAILSYRVRDALLAVGKSWDWEDTIRDITMTVVAQVVANYAYEELCKALQGDELATILKECCRRELRRYGIGVEKVALTDFCPANVIALCGDTLTPGAE